MGLSYGEGENLSRVKVLTEGRVIITHGFGLGQVMTLRDWFVLIGADDSSPEASIDTKIGKALYGILKNKNEHISRPATVEVPTKRSNSVEIREPAAEGIPVSVDKNYANGMIYKELIVGPRLHHIIQEPEPEPKQVPNIRRSKSVTIPPKSKIPWYMKFIMCGMEF